MANPWTAFYWRDYIADTGHLSLAEHGAYLLLMAHYYSTRKPIDANASVLHRVCRCTTDADMAAMQRVLDEFFVLEDGCYRNPRIDRELSKAIDISGKRRGAAQKRWAEKQAPNADANAMQMHIQKHTQPQPQRESFVLDQKLSLFKEDWNQFEVMRKKIRKPMTDQARKNICAKLLRFQASGHDPGHILQNSITNSWQDVYEPKGNSNGNKASRADQLLADLRARQSAEEADGGVQGSILGQ